MFKFLTSMKVTPYLIFISSCRYSGLTKVFSLIFSKIKNMKILYLRISANIFGFLE